ncbi:MAG: magnesium/cobalt transporter CorA [Faecalispora jeddahensis]
MFESIRRRIQADARVRSMGADHLVYLLLDAIVDGYFDVLETIGGQIDDLEDSIMEQTTKQHLLQIRAIKKNLLRVNRHIWPLRNVASLMDKESSELIHPETEPYLRDVYNHIVQAIDSTETYRDLLSGLADLHFSNISYRMNEIMKVLTIISTIFIPLTFIVGVYGMNFKYMPELNQTWGYPVVWAVMVAVSIVMILFFKKKKWF